MNFDDREPYIKYAYPHEAPGLCLKWSLDSSQIVSGDADHKGRLYHIETGKQVEFAHHEVSIKPIVFAGYNLMVTDSRGKTIKYWDIRATGSAGILSLSKRIYTMDVCRSWIVVGTADNSVHHIDTMAPDTIMKTMASPLEHQMLKIRCFLKGDGFAMSLIEGRVAIEYTKQIDQAKSFTFKCHRDENNIFAVNDLDFHPSEQGTLLTAGSDGTINIWKKINGKNQRHIAGWMDTFPVQHSVETGLPLLMQSAMIGPRYGTRMNHDARELFNNIPKIKGYKFATDTNKIYIHDMEQFE